VKFDPESHFKMKHFLNKLSSPQFTNDGARASTACHTDNHNPEKVVVCFCKVSISSTLNIRIFRTNVIFLVTFWLCRKIRAFNVDEIDGRLSFASARTTTSVIRRKHSVRASWSRCRRLSSQFHHSFENCQS